MKINLAAQTTAVVQRMEREMQASAHQAAAMRAKFDEMCPDGDIDKFVDNKDQLKAFIGGLGPAWTGPGPWARVGPCPWPVPVAGLWGAAVPKAPVPEAAVLEAFFPSGGCPVARPHAWPAQTCARPRSRPS